MSHRPLAISAGLQLHFDPSHDLPVIMGDTNQISRVISNLVTNAIHYTKQGIVTIRTYRSRHGVYLDVIDTGMGIDPEDQPHLFERFYRGRYVRQSNIPGTGLGLAIVKEILDRHSSQILIHSELGQGSTFTVCFPPVMDEVWAVNSY
jgi:signal transduction histidine kinase